jgi:hypothetical protein
MGDYLHSVRYAFVTELAVRENVDAGQLLVDCILADGIDAGVVSHDGSRYTSFDQVLPLGIEDKLLPASTKERLLVPVLRAAAMSEAILSFVDTDARWEDQTLQASWRTCEVSVAGKFRKNDAATPFSQHPLEATAVLYEAIKRAQEGRVQIPRKEVIALLATCLMHDSVEDWVKKTDHYSLDPTVEVISPLVIKTLLQKTGLPNTLPAFVANATRLMTHEKGQPWMHTYQEYVARLVSNFLAAIVKPAGDSYHNYQIDRLPEPQIKDGEPDELFQKRLVKYQSKQALLAQNIFGDGVINAQILDGRNRTNAYQNDSRGRRYGRQILGSVRGIVEREGDRTKYPHVDWSRAVPLDVFKNEVLPKYVENLQKDFSIPKTTLVAG